MSKNILEVILKTINDVQSKNAANPKERTADPSIFDLLKKGLQKVDSKSRQKRVQKGKSPESILDLIRGQIEGVQKKNKKDPNVETAPKSIFEELLKKVNKQPKQIANSGLKRIINEYGINVSRVPKKVLQDVQQQMIRDQQNFDRQYANALADLVRRY